MQRVLKLTFVGEHDGRVFVHFSAPDLSLHWDHLPASELAGIAATLEGAHLLEAKPELIATSTPTSIVATRTWIEQHGALLSNFGEWIPLALEARGAADTIANEVRRGSYFGFHCTNVVPRQVPIVEDQAPGPVGMDLEHALDRLSERYDLDADPFPVSAVFTIAGRSFLACSSASIADDLAAVSVPVSVDADVVWASDRAVVRRFGEGWLPNEP